MAALNAEIMSQLAASLEGAIWVALEPSISHCSLSFLTVSTHAAILSLRLLRLGLVLVSRMAALGS
jgi:hypothetical protein